MKWSKAQTEAHEANYEKFRQAYLEGKNSFSPIEQIENNGNRCITLVHKPSRMERQLGAIYANINEEIPGMYPQEISHFTLDCHRYRKANEIATDIKEKPVIEQIESVISPEELKAYVAVLKEEIKNEPYFEYELKGICIGGDGLIAQVWYDDERMTDFTSRLGERVRKEVPSMEFQWGIVKNKVPLRVLNLTRFTGKEDRTNVLEYANKNRDTEIGRDLIMNADLLFSDHYISRKNTRQLESFCFI